MYYKYLNKIVYITDKQATWIDTGYSSYHPSVIEAILLWARPLTQEEIELVLLKAL